ncbi:MAG: porin family protein [Mucilaginibacter sp.]
MKKLHLLAILLLFAGSVSAQYYDPNAPRRPRRYVRKEQPANQVQVGFAAGLNTSNIVDANNSYYSTGNLTGFNAGLTFDVPIVYNFSFAPEVRYSQKGYFAETTDGNLTQHFNFIDVPLLAKFKLVPGFNLYVGPQISFLVSSNQTFDNGFVVSRQNTYDYTGNNTFIDGVVGVSFDITRYFDLHARYAIDLNSTSSNSTVIPDYRNQTWQFGFGIKFN